MESKLISVIVPVYKVEKYLCRCIDSILNQTYKNLEIILVDDGSPDSCGNICDDYALRDSRIKVVHKENGGLSSARNAGIDIAEGEYLSFIDSDDYIAPEFIERLYKLCIDNNADIAQCAFLSTDKDDEKWDNLSTFTKVFTNEEMLYNLYNQLYVPTVVAVTKLYKKTVFDNVRFPFKKVYEDEATSYKLIYNAKRIVVVDEKLYFYYTNPESITHIDSLSRKSDYLYALRDRIDFLKKKNLNKLCKNDILHFVYYYLRYGNYFDIEIKKELQKDYQIFAKKIIFKDFKIKQKVKFLIYLALENFKKIAKKGN